LLEARPGLSVARNSAAVLYPYSAGIFGTGANFVVSRAAFEALGGFDEVLGAGALTRGGEDLDWFVRTLHQGFALAYEPGRSCGTGTGVTSTTSATSCTATGPA
jgi:hypothetical protein